VIIIGGGIAGLFCALKLAPRPVTILAAAPMGKGASSAWAQGGVAAAVAEGDTPQAHARDIAVAVAGLDHSQRVSIEAKLLDPKEALASFDRILALDGAHMEAAIERGIVLIGLKHYEEALNAFEILFDWRLAAAPR
jgi:glycine/D-amino acid oxidase-like deaminating enzyme